MFIGHFAAALAAKKIDNKPSLGTLFFAAQWLDLLWPALLLTGTESVELSTDGSNPIPLNFSHYPISHSLLMVIGWSALMGILHFLFRKNLKTALIIALLVLSHWILDWLVHIPDLPISPFNDLKTGLGIWQYKYLALALELLLFGAGVFLYSNATRASNKTGKYALWSLVVFLVVVHLMNIFGPPPTDAKPIAYVGFSQWLLVAWAYWADKNRHSST